MTLLDHPRTGSADVVDDAVIDLAPDRPDRAPSPGPRARSGPDAPAPGPVVDPDGRVAYRGMRIRRVRLGSAATISLVFWALTYAVLLGTVVAVWRIVEAFGFVDSFEETVITSLGLEAFEVDGGGMFGVVAAGLGFLCALGWVATIAVAAVYNATCGVFGGLAVETGPLQRRRRVFSWRHRRFVTVSR